MPVFTSEIGTADTQAGTFEPGGVSSVAPTLLTGTSAIVFTVTGTLSVSNIVVAFTGAIALTTTVSGTLRQVVVPLTGTSALALTVSGTLSVAATPTVSFSGTSALRLSVTGTLHLGRVDFSGTAAIRLALNGVPTIEVPTVGGPTGVTILLRRPVLDVKIDGHSQTKIVAASCHFGFDARYATAELVYAATEGVTPSYWMPVEITMGANAATAVPRFYGYILPIDNTAWPKRGTLKLRGPLGIAAALQNADNTWVATNNVYGTDFYGLTDQEIAVAILTYYGLTDRFVYTPPLGGAFGDTVAGTGNVLGANPLIGTWVWPMGSFGLAYLDQLDQCCAAQDALGNWGVYKTLETVGGEADKTLFRTLITGNPQLAAGDADFSLTEGVDLLRDLEVTHDPQQVANAIRVAGGDPFGEPALMANYPQYIPSIPATPPPYLTASSPYLPSFMPNNPTTGYPTVLRDFTFPMIERSTTADAWNGLTAESKARQLLQELNTEVVTLRVSTYRDDLFGPGQTHHIHAPIRAGVFQNLWLQTLDITMSAQRVFRQRMSYSAKN